MPVRGRFPTAERWPPPRMGRMLRPGGRWAVPGRGRALTSPSLLASQAPRRDLVNEAWAAWEGVAVVQRVR